MKLLLDECIDCRLAKEFQGHDVVTVPQAGWAGIQNGELPGVQALGVVSLVAGVAFLGVGVWRFFTIKAGIDQQSD